MQIKFDCEKNLAVIISNSLTELGATVIITNATNERVFAINNEQPLWEIVTITGIFSDTINLDTLTQSLQQQYNITASIERFEPTDWEVEYKQHFKPMQFGKKLWVYPSWESIPTHKKHTIILDPGMAFGTGTHPTTAMCLTWLDTHVKPNDTVIDYGCGTGILGIAAATLGATSVIAIDNDNQALAATQANAIQNNVFEQLSIFSPQETPNIQADIVIANILANPLIDLAPTLAKLLKPNSKLALSGILEDQANRVIKAYAQYMHLKVCEQTEDWVLLTS